VSDVVLLFLKLNVKGKKITDIVNNFCKSICEKNEVLLLVYYQRWSHGSSGSSQTVNKSSNSGKKNGSGFGSSSGYIVLVITMATSNSQAITASDTLFTVQ